MTRKGGTDRGVVFKDGVLSAFGEQDANTITPRQIERVFTELQTELRKPATVFLRYLAVLKAARNRGKRLGQLRENPASLLTTAKPNNVLVRYLTEARQGALLAALPQRFHPIVTTAIDTGLRQGELLRLTWQVVEWTIGVLTIHETKACERRRVPMNSTVQTLLAGMRDAGKPVPTDRVFPHDHRYLRRDFAKAVDRANLAPFRFHDLRHTFASRLAMNGVNDRTLMALGGWKSPRMLDRYAHLSLAHLMAGD